MCPGGHVLHGWGTLSVDGITGMITFEATLYLQLDRQGMGNKEIGAKRMPATDAVERMHYAFMWELDNALHNSPVYPA
jgi:hypothetical protein